MVITRKGALLRDMFEHIYRLKGKKEIDVLEEVFNSSVLWMQEG